MAAVSTPSTPYRLQVFIPDELRQALREAAYRERVSQQQLVVRWLAEKLREYHDSASEAEDTP